MSREIIGESKPVKDLITLIRRVAQAKTNILVIGESGTGKELIARMIHDEGPLKKGPFVPVNCGAIPETLIESELFGYKRGSFTGAVGDKAGLFEAADGGTLFLDEVGELPLSMQVKLLRAIQERCFRKVGGTDDIRVDVRIIAATNRDLEAGVRAGTFREDLFYRLNVILIKAPPLRERRGDIRILAEHFLQKFANQCHKKMTGFETGMMEAFEAHPWPGNVRELENVVERVVTLSNGEVASLSALPSTIVLRPAGAQPGDGAKAAGAAGAGNAGAVPPAEIKLPAPDFSAGPLDLDKILGDVERTYLNAALAHAGGVKKKAASLLGITFRSIRYRLKKLGVESEDGDSGDSGDEE